MMLKSSRLGISALLLTACSALSTSALTKNWATGDGNWFVDGNWSPVGVPAPTENVSIVFADNVARTITVDANANGAVANTINVDLTGGSNASTLAITGNTLSESLVAVGVTGNGAINQTAGIHTVSSLLDVGENSSAVGTYTLSGGTLNSFSSSVIGDLGTGTFTQSGGSHLGSSLIIGNGSSGVGTYSLAGSSTLLQVGVETVGWSATGNGTQNGGAFTQTGGANQAGQLFLAQNPLSTASYTLSGGTLNAGSNEFIGYGGSANFNQTGGANSTSELDVATVSGGNGGYKISGGGLQATNINVGGTSFQTGGTGTLTISGTAIANVGSALNIFNTPGSSVALQGGTLSTPAINVNGAPPLFKWTGGTLNLTNGVTWDPALGPYSTSAIFGSSL